MVPRWNNNMTVMPHVKVATITKVTVWCCNSRHVKMRKGVSLSIINASARLEDIKWLFSAVYDKGDIN